MRSGLGSKKEVKETGIFMIIVGIMVGLIVWPLYGLIVAAVGGILVLGAIGASE